MVRDDIASALSGAAPIGNSVLRVISDTNAGLGHLVLRYIDWLARQLMPDTAETDWLDRFAVIWIPPGRKVATYGFGVITITGTNLTTLPVGSLFSTTSGDGTAATYQTTEIVMVGSAPTPVPVAAITPGFIGLVIGNTMGLVTSVAGIDSSATITSFTDGVDTETDEQLRARVLFRIRQPPMGGDANDYVAWASEVAGVTRAWAAQEMGIGTITIRFMMDDLRATTDPLTNGFPLSGDIDTVLAHVDTKRPVAIKDFFVFAPVPQPVSFTINNLFPSNAAVKAAIEANVSAMLHDKARPAHTIDGVLQPAQTIYAAWVNEAIMGATGVEYFDLVMDDLVMPANGYMGVLGSIVYG